MGPLLYMQSIIGRNVVMLHMTVQEKVMNEGHSSMCGCCYSTFERPKSGIE